MRWRAEVRSRWDLSAVVALVAFIGGVASILAATGMYAVWRGAPGADLWQEIAWPFGRDAWPAGRAFRCTGTICGSGIELYVRPKIGFCNCATGVADDNEVDRVTDLDLITPRFAPLASGQPVQVADMAGRARDYELQMPDGAAGDRNRRVARLRCNCRRRPRAGCGSAGCTEQRARPVVVGRRNDVAERRPRRRHRPVTGIAK
jgi:hypothetical protein